MDLYVTRSEWGARAASGSTPLTGSKGFGLHYNGPAMRLSSHSDCDDAVRGIQRYHQTTKGWWDIAYSFLVCPHGAVFVGRGWGKRTAANGTNDANDDYHAVMVMIGVGEEPRPVVLDAVTRLTVTHREKYGRTDLKPHRDFKSTECPGDTLTAWARNTWTPSGGGSSSSTSTTEAIVNALPVLSSGAKGLAVKRVQALVNIQGGDPTLALDGDYGPNTVREVTQFQRRRGLDDDGIVGPDTWAALLGV